MAFAFALLHFLLFSTFITFLWFSIATSTPVTSPIAKPSHRFVVNLKARKIIALNRPIARARLEYDVDLSILAEFSIGEPPVKQLAIVDTGSSLTLVQCFPCKPCVELLRPIFKRSRSSTYSNFPCPHGTRCEYYGNCKCNLLNQAEYWTHYLDDSSSTGILAIEQFVFETSDKITLIATDIVFGCSREIKNGIGSLNAGVGIIGMNPASSSLVRQLGDKFSYCIGSLNDPNYKYSQLIIGEGANILGDNTPFTTGINSIKNYYVQLESINIDGKPLDINMAELELDFDGNGGVIIDSGATIIDLNPAAFFPLRNDVKKRMSNFKLISGNNDFLCYEGEPSKVLRDFPR